MRHLHVKVDLPAMAMPPVVAGLGRYAAAVAAPRRVVTEYSVRSENTGVPIIREIMVATTMSSFFVVFFALRACTFRTRAALQG